VRKVLKWVGIALGALVAVLVLAVLGLYVNSTMRLDKTYQVKAEPLTLPADSASIARGKHLTAILCVDCHGQDLSGTKLLDNPTIGSVHASNLTSGKGGSGAEFTTADWVLALRHGLSPEHKPLLIMPSANFYHLSDQDLGAIVAYVKSVPAVDKSWADHSLKPKGRLLVGVGAIPGMISAEAIDQTGPRPVSPAPGPSAAYGGYLVNVFGCASCHGKGLAGGKDPNPAAPPAPDLTRKGELRLWTESDFVTAARTRVTEFMPWNDMSRMTDDELKAIWLYLQSLSAR
jgi:mono/diheme cytochrome c family protein